MAAEQNKKGGRERCPRCGADVRPESRRWRDKAGLWVGCDVCLHVWLLNQDGDDDNEV